MELVTENNIQYGKRVKLTKDGIEFYKSIVTQELSTSLKNHIFLLHGKHVEKWILIKSEDGTILYDSDGYELGARIGHGNMYDIYYPEFYNIEDIKNNLDKLEKNLYEKGRQS